MLLSLLLGVVGERTVLLSLWHLSLRIWQKPLEETRCRVVDKRGIREDTELFKKAPTLKEASSELSFNEEVVATN